MEFLFVLAFLQIKHWYIDFVLQSSEQIRTKAIYGHPVGISHSIDHSIGTLIALLCCSFFMQIDVYLILVAAALDGITHYHIDWAKGNWGVSDITNKAFWSHLGLDQMAHQLVYLNLILVLF